MFQGRGWHQRGAHTSGFNNKSIGVAFLGDYSGTLGACAAQPCEHGPDTATPSPLLTSRSSEAGNPEWLTLARTRAGSVPDSGASGRQMNALRDLLRCGVALGELPEDVRLYGQRQVQRTESPGLALYQQLQELPQWVEVP